MADTSEIVGYCGECGEPIHESDSCKPEYPGVYECSKCGYPNAQQDLNC